MKKKKNQIKLFCEFVIPPMLIWASIVVIPLIYGIYLTFTNWNGLSPNYDLVGFSNYAAIFTDKTFLSSLWKTFVYVFFVVVFSNVLGLALALLLTYGIKLQGLFRTCFFAANMIGGVVMGYIWNYIFSFALTKVGAVTGWGFFQKSWNRTGSPDRCCRMAAERISDGYLCSRSDQRFQRYAGSSKDRRSKLQTASPFHQDSDDPFFHHNLCIHGNFQSIHVLRREPDSDSRRPLQVHRALSTENLPDCIQ